MVSASVRGMGVAVMESKCGRNTEPRGSFSFPRAKARLWLIPKRGCSSMTQSARFLNCTDFWIRAWVPINIGNSPFATHFKSWAREMVVQDLGFTLDGNFRQPDPVMRPIWMFKFLASPASGRGEKYLMKDSKCWVARISVGAI